MGSSRFDEENSRLNWSWDRFSREHLDSYLVAGIEDPRINCQSILTRALIADTLWPNKHTDLIDAELRFGVVLTWLLIQLDHGIDRFELLESVADDRCRSCPQLVHETYNWLQSDECPVPDYVSEAIEQVDPDSPDKLIDESALDTFSMFWKNTLAKLHAEPVSIVEPACGSANDYRFIDRYGLSGFIDYTGFDISRNNIENATSRFPDVDFRVASILDSDIQDESFDYLYVHDLFEHLSLDAINQALTEVVRIARREAWLHFFNACDNDEHLVRPVEKYHWNRLSIDRVSETIETLGAGVEVIPIANFLNTKFGFDGYYNPYAVTMLVRKPR